MRVPLRRVGRDASFNMTPMIDVVFLLIIFFLVSSHLARQEVQFEVELPEATTGMEDQAGENTRRLVLNVPREKAGDGHVLVGSSPTSPEELSALIRHEHDRARRDNRQLEVRIRTDRDVPYGRVEPILLTCARAGVWNVRFAVWEKN